MEKNPGKLFEIIDGTHKGKYCVAYNKEQQQHYLKQSRLFVHYFDDMLLKKPTRFVDSDGKYPASAGKKLLGIEKIEKLKLIGYLD